MVKRYHMRTRDGRRFMEETYDREGLENLKYNRRHRPEMFKGMHIKEVIQAYPGKVATGVIYEYTY